MNGGKTEGNKGGKKSCAVTFECENDSLVGPMFDVMHFARDAPCTMGERRNKKD